jgi:hypothetical protein
MPGFMPGIHDFFHVFATTWMAGTWRGDDAWRYTGPAATKIGEEGA